MRDIRRDCGNGESITEYIYGEFPESMRSELEAHLLTCEMCADEFAATAESRFDVYEWRKLDLDPIATPEFAIPYRRSKSAFATLVWSIRNGISANWATAGVAVGALVLVAVAAFYFSGPAADGPVVALESSAEQMASPAVAETPLTLTEYAQPENPRAVKPVAARRTSRAATPRAKGARITPKPAASPAAAVSTAATAPTLTEFTDDEDRTLRLSDLYAEFDGGE